MSSSSMRPSWWSVSPFGLMPPPLQPNIHTHSRDIESILKMANSWTNALKRRMTMTARIMKMWTMKSWRKTKEDLVTFASSSPSSHSLSACCRPLSPFPASFASSLPPLSHYCRRKVPLPPSLAPTWVEMSGPRKHSYRTLQ
ncbi:unnamed protein product [Taenia asiatica]|uniref:Uncharacterized protein n=1 Tax=Taenia asiatica TaxID=60517 RepID=A0A3P6NPG6_TAEAS|nr:unnamed protein product [Taenia asiatica]